MKNPTLDNLIDRIRAAQRVALLLHVSPDGDTCGSALALRRALALSGKTVAVVCDHPVPRIYDDLEGADTVVTPDTLAGEVFDLAIAVDAADRLRLGASVQVLDAALKNAQIDHHHTNPGYAEVNYLRSPLSATGVLALEVIDAMGVALDLPLAQCLFVAVSTDTGNFKQQNTDADALRLAARCVEVGLDPSVVTRKVFDVKPLPQMKLIARALESLTLYDGGKVALMRLDKETFQQVGALGEHTEGIVNYGINTEGVRVACLLSQGGEKIKGSLRSLPPYDVSVVACALGGGGHALAAGCTMSGTMDEAYAQMLAEIEKELKRNA